MGVPNDLAPLHAGRFSSWLVEVAGALEGEHGTDVPCGTCVGCCSSSQFVHLEPDELEAKAHIPAELLFPAPRLPEGHLLLGYDERGRCPMLDEAGCTIYEHRPRTCRTYDCRIFPAAGVDPDPVDQPAIAARVVRWEFDEPDEIDRVLHDAVRAAADHVRRRRGELPDEVAPATPTQHALLALHLHTAFLGVDADGRAAVVEPAPGAVEVALRARRRS